MRLLDALANYADALFAQSSGSGGTNICSASTCLSTCFSSSFGTTSVFASAGTGWQFGSPRHCHPSSGSSWPLTVASTNSCGTSLRHHLEGCSLHQKRIPKSLDQLETRSEASSSWRAEGSQYVSSCQQNTSCKSLHSPVMCSHDATSHG